MSKIVLTNKINSGFLAIVLIAGTFAALPPSLMTRAQAFQMDNNYKPDYGMNSYDYKKSYGNDDYRDYKSRDSSNIIVKKVECNNINVNNNRFNGVEVGTLPTDLYGLATDEAQVVDEREVGASSFESGGRPSGSDTDIRVVCIYNNNFEVVETPPLTLMTWNIYQGADLSPIFLAPNEDSFKAAVWAAYNRIQDTNFVERADSIANEIQETRPDMIGLQEVILLRTQTPSDPTTPATSVSFDYLQILIDNLAKRGLIYEPIIVQTGTDIEVPGLTSTGEVDIRLTDRDVILAQADRDFTLSNLNGAQFAAKLQVPTPFGFPVNLPHSWVSVDITFDKGIKARLVSTHLEPISPVVQGLQAEELLNGPGKTDLPIIFIGDYNSNADGTGTPTYIKLTDKGFIDAWSIKGIGSGFTCCQDANLQNPDSKLNKRIDLVMFRGNFEVKDIGLVGNSQNDRTMSGLWPSDHAGVVATLKLNNDKN